MNPALRFLFLILASVVIASPTFSLGPAKGGALTVCQPAEPPGLDPTANTAAAIDRVVYANIFEGLVKVDSNGGFLPLPVWLTAGRYRQTAGSIPST